VLRGVQALVDERARDVDGHLDGGLLEDHERILLGPFDVPLRAGGKLLGLLAGLGDDRLLTWWRRPSPPRYRRCVLPRGLEVGVVLSITPGPPPAPLRRVESRMSAARLSMAWMMGGKRYLRRTARTMTKERMAQMV
jgi:hypothetical protein